MSKNKKISVEDLAKKIKKIIHRKALGYERDLDFCYGMISAWLDLGIITRKGYNELTDNFAHYNQDYSEEEEHEEKLQKKYGRILSYL